MLVLAAAMVGLLAMACGDDDGTVSGSASGSGSGSGVASGSGSGVAGCELAGSGATDVTVTLQEWSVEAAESSVTAGDVRFVAKNEGEEPHELVVVRADSPDELTVEDGKVAEDALPDGALIGEIEPFPAGQTCERSFELAAGNYVLFCNIVEQEDGRLESHFENGMRTQLVVS
jgi:uncharacterized cupredoxin-like copper-binding protein